jgi:transposase-like protein
VMDVLQEVIQELMQSDNYMRQQTAWIAQCTHSSRLRNSLLLASIEEYCLRPIRNQPLLVYRFVNYLRRSQRGGMTQVPTGDLIRLVSEEITPDDADNPVNLLDAQAVAQYQDTQVWQEQQALRDRVIQEFTVYLSDHVEPMAAEWLRLHLKGQSQESIAQTLDLPIKAVYRLREKITYHAIRVFAFKQQPELVGVWLGTTLAEHRLGLAQEQWDRFWQSCSPLQQQILQHLRSGVPIEAIAKQLGLKTNQVMSEWSKLYLAAQALRAA